MAVIFSTPISLVVAFLALLTFTIPKWKQKWWAMLGKWLCVGFFGFYIVSAMQVMNIKATVGARKHDAHKVMVFTTEVSRLIAEGEHKKAKELLEKFNNEYPALAGHNDADVFLDKLTEVAHGK